MYAISDQGYSAGARFSQQACWCRSRRDSGAIGAISVTRVEPGSFAPHHVQLLQTFADQAVIAIQNVRLFNETKEALERQTATADMLKVISKLDGELPSRCSKTSSTAIKRLFDCKEIGNFRVQSGGRHLASDGRSQAPTWSLYRRCTLCPSSQDRRLCS